MWVSSSYCETLFVAPFISLCSNDTLATFMHSHFSLQHPNADSLYIEKINVGEAGWFVHLHPFPSFLHSHIKSWYHCVLCKISGHCNDIWEHFTVATCSHVACVSKWVISQFLMSLQNLVQLWVAWLISCHWRNFTIDWLWLSAIWNLSQWEVEYMYMQGCQSP